MYLQYVHDFGDWWSHTIRVTKYDGSVPSNGTVAHLMSGTGCCPPEDIGGIVNYSEVMFQLNGVTKVKKDSNVLEGDDYIIDPTSERWWAILNNEVRKKHNGSGVSSPIDFDLEVNRTNLDLAIRNPNKKAGKENKKLTHCSMGGALASESYGNDYSISTEMKATKSCAVCGVMVALKYCSGCKSIAFCSRDHQLKHWPQHKSECKRIRKEQKRQK